MEAVQNVIYEVAGEFASFNGHDLIGLRTKETDVGPAARRALKSDATPVTEWAGRGDGWQARVRIGGHLSDSGQGLLQNQLLGLDLKGVLQMLPVAAATISEVVTAGHDPIWGAGTKVFCAAPQVASPIFGNRHIHKVSGCSEGYKDHFVLNAPDTFTAVGEGFDRQGFHVSGFQSYILARFVQVAH
jgi:hypothetical protein